MHRRLHGQTRPSQHAYGLAKASTCLPKQRKAGKCLVLSASSARSPHLHLAPPCRAPACSWPARTCGLYIVPGRGQQPCCQPVPGNRLACSKISSGSSLNQVWCCTAGPAAGLLGHFALVRMPPPASSEHSRGGGNPNKHALRLRQARSVSCCSTLGRHTSELCCRSSVVVRSKLPDPGKDKGRAEKTGTRMQCLAGRVHWRTCRDERRQEMMKGARSVAQVSLRHHHTGRVRP